MKKLTQFALNNIAAGRSGEYGSLGSQNNQPQAGPKEDFISGAIQALGA